MLRAGGPPTKDGVLKFLFIIAKAVPQILIDFEKLRVILADSALRGVLIQESNTETLSVIDTLFLDFCYNFT